MDNSARSYGNLPTGPLPDDDERWPSVKEAHRLDPILLRGKEKGTGTTEEPLSSRALSEYLLIRGRKVGYGENISFYSIRRQSGRMNNDVVTRGR
ncbi:hypothetical protein QBC37DRAFT_379693 [Rhypophila decipiens]|uniref:Uncharacterized protein n=1 Tax=Rhypophila decipiens TaxID=261697 RepID=A0AAN6XWE4_9PEZI|nr:hypothetical protein QBC37DRAFT_379693 [Rhypophila decipiens]